MSEREQAKMILDRLPEYKIPKILLFLQGIAFDDEMEDDLYCAKLFEEYKADPEKDVFFDGEDCKREWGLD